MKTFELIGTIFASLFLLASIGFSIWVIAGGYRVGFGIFLLIVSLACLVMVIKENLY